MKWFAGNNIFDSSAPSPQPPPRLPQLILELEGTVSGSLGQTTNTAIVKEGYKIQRRVTWRAAGYGLRGQPIPSRGTRRRARRTPAEQPSSRAAELRSSASRERCVTATQLIRCRSRAQGPKGRRALGSACGAGSGSPRVGQVQGRAEAEPALGSSSETKGQPAGVRAARQLGVRAKGHGGPRGPALFPFPWPCARKSLQSEVSTVAAALPILAVIIDHTTLIYLDSSDRRGRRFACFVATSDFSTQQ